MLDHVTSKWGVLVLVGLAEESPLVGKLRRRVRASARDAGADAPHTRGRRARVPHAFAVVPPHVEYALTPLGEELAERLVDLMSWIVEHADGIVGAAASA